MSERQIDFDLYLITDRKLFTDNDFFLKAVEAALAAGVKALQLREKDLPTRELLAMAYSLRELTAKYGAKLFINERADIALCVKADGLHLGRTSMPTYAVRKVVGKEVLLGVSTHNLNEAVEAEKDGADFITLGPVYPTPSKMKYGEPAGLEALKEVAGRVSLPVFGIGGIKPENAGDVMGAGAAGVAVISGILGVADINTSAGRYLSCI